VFKPIEHFIRDIFLSWIVMLAMFGGHEYGINALIANKGIRDSRFHDFV